MTEIARATQTPTDLASMLCLSALATALAKVVEVEVRPGWREPVNLFTVSVLASGNRKSAVEREVTAPIIAYERALALQMGPAISNAKAQKSVLEARLKKAQGLAAKPLGGDFDVNDYASAMDAVEKLQRELDEAKVPATPRLLADDCTPEKLAGLMAANGGRISVLSSEAEILSQANGKYQSGAVNLNVFLKGHAGDDFRVDRIGREPEYIRRPSVTLGITTQPSVLHGLGNVSAFRGTGFLARLLFSLMTSTVGERNSRAVPASEHVREAYAHTLTALLRLPHEVDEHGEWVSHMLLLTSDAHEDLVGLIERIEPLLAPGAALGHIPDWAGKLAGAVARIAGLLHCAAVVAETSANPWDSSIESSTMRGALLIGEYLLAHALEAFRQMGADERLRDAEIVLAWIKRNRRVTVTRREMFRGVTSSRFRHVADLEPAISELVERGYIRSRNPEPGKSGRPSQVFDVNPAVIEGGTAAGSVSFVSHSACL